jgi:hypothetical protein
MATHQHHAQRDPRPPLHAAQLSRAVADHVKTIYFLLPAIEELSAAKWLPPTDFYRPTCDGGSWGRAVTPFRIDPPRKYSGGFSVWTFELKGSELSSPL